MSALTGFHFPNGNYTVFARLSPAAERESASFVNLAAVADIVEINAAKVHVEFVKYPVVADAEFEFRTALQPFMREILQTQAHFINLALHELPNARRQVIE